jgi:hypothetical protein
VGVKYKIAIRELQQKSLQEGKLSLDANWLDNVRARFDDLETGAPVVPRRIYDRVARTYLRGIRLVPRATDLYGPNAPGRRSGEEIRDRKV